MASTDHGHTIRDLAIVLSQALNDHPEHAPSKSVTALHRLASMLAIQPGTPVDEVDDKLYSLLIEDDHDMTEVESAFYREYARRA